MTATALRRAVLAFLSIGVAAGVWGFLIEPGLVVTREVRIETAGWQEGRATLRVAVLGDLHVGAPHWGIEALDDVVARVNALEPDVVVLLGDYVIHGVLFGNFVEPSATARSLSSLTPRYGVVAVLGNHDWWYDGPGIRAALESAGIVVLENQSHAIATPEGRVWFAGIADDMTRSPDPVATVAAVPEGEPVIAIAHDPVVVFDMPDRVAVTLAAHMHGGQVYLPVIGALITPGRGPRRLAYGHIREDGKDLYVTSGLGTSIIPVRFNMPPEIVLVTLAPGRSE